MKAAWVDLSEYGLQLNLVQTPKNTHKLVIRGLDARKYSTDALRLGFRTHAENVHVLVKDVTLNALGTMEESVSLSSWKTVFQKAKPDVFEEERHLIVLQAPGQAATQATAAKPVINSDGSRLLTGGRSVGINKFGQEVFDLDGERYVKDQRGQSVSERGGGAPFLFLRAADLEALNACAEGFLEQAVKGRILRAEDLARFIETTGFSGDRSEVVDAIRAAFARHLAKRGGNTLGDAYIVASRLHESLACLTDGSVETVNAAPPMVVAAQRILGLEPGLKDRRVAVEDNGPGFILSHLPKQADYEIHTSSPASAKATAAVRALGSITIKDGGTPAPGLRALYSELGSDYSLIDGRVAALADDATAVILVDAPRDSESRKELDAIRDRLARDRKFEGEARVEAGLWSGRPDQPEKIMLAIGAKRQVASDDALPPPARAIHDWTSLWTWTAEVVSARSRDAEKLVAGEEAAVNLNKGIDPNGANSFQAPYVSASRVGTPSTMVPRNLEASTREALARVVRLYGDIDAFVAREFSYEVEELSKLFSPEQVDALALYLHAEERGRGFLNADQTGVGKGRTLAAILRRAAIKGKKVLFLTERQQNLSDIWRDVMHTKSAEYFNPMVINEDAALIDEATKKVVMRGAAREEVDAMLSSGSWPTGVNLILGTYSQFNRDTENKKGKDNMSTRKSGWLSNAIDADALMALDESHNAASAESNVGKNIAEAVKRAGSVVYSSATFAKTADHMAFYAPLMPDGLSGTELEAMMERGGETFQEVLSGMLVQDGVMIRREFDLSRVTYRTLVDTTRFDRNRGYMDAIAPILSELVKLSGSIDQHIRAANEGANRRDAQPDAEQARAGDMPYKLTRSGFGSPLYTISRLFVAALKIDVVVDSALDALRNNKKPVIVVENTIQSLLEELADRDADVEGDVVADFRALFHRITRRMTESQFKDEKQVVHRRDMTAGQPALVAAVDRIRRMIDALPDLPASAVDEVKRRINETGFTCDEITGRTLEIRNGRVMRRNSASSTVIKNMFNSGELDAVIINSAGSTGIDLHAGSRFADQRPRVLMELQAPADILRKVQGHGRVNRYDQVEDPEIWSFLSGLPIETRLAAMENAKLRRLSANTTSNRDAAILVRGIPDLINPVGDIVCSRYAEARPDLMRKLGFKVDSIQQGAEVNRGKETAAADNLRDRLKSARGRKVVPAANRVEEFVVADTKRTANEILSRLIMLPVSVQERVCNELTAEFNAAIEELEARGETPLRTHELSGIVHERSRTIFDGADSDDVDSVFQEPLYVVEGAIERTGKPIKTDGLLERIQIGEMASGRALGCIERLRLGMQEILTPYLPDGMTVDEALVAGHKEITKRKDIIERLANGLETIKPGVQVTYTLDGAATSGIVTRIDYPARGYEHVPSAYGVEFVVPGDEKPRSMRLETLLKDPSFAVDKGLESNDYEKILKRFDDANAIKLQSVRILVNNLYRAMKYNAEYKLGRLVTFKTADGVVNRGIVISNRHRELKSLPVEVPGAKMCEDAVADGIEIVGSSMMTDKSLSLRSAGEGAVEVKLPARNSRKLAFVFDNPRIDNLARRGVESVGAITVTILKSELKEVLEALHEAGAAFYAAPVHRQWTLDWAKIHSSSRERLTAPAMIP